jgi:hypothetical protein
MNRIEREIATVSAMVRHYCRKHHKSRHLCSECSMLDEYAHVRLEKCKFGNEKPTCKACPVHCYSVPMREKIRDVMRFSGPAMIYRHPILAFYHLTIDSK